LLKFCSKNISATTVEASGVAATYIYILDTYIIPLLNCNYVYDVINYAKEPLCVNFMYGCLLGFAACVIIGTVLWFYGVFALLGQKRFKTSALAAY